MMCGNTYFVMVFFAHIIPSNYLQKSGRFNSKEIDLVFVSN